MNDWIISSWRQPSFLSADRFSFIGMAGDLSCVRWDGPQRSRLWRYNQHYFDDLTALRASERNHYQKEILKDWLTANSEVNGTAWEPYPTSLRTVNWIKWILVGHELEIEFLHSLYLQARWLRRNLELDLLGNHLLANVKALIFAGAFFDTPESNEWLFLGKKILLEQLGDQILSDGGHYERSPMYHSIINEDILDLINLSRVYPNALDDTLIKELQSVGDRMLCWLKLMTHPDGDVAFFNDVAIGSFANVRDIERYRSLLGLSCDLSDKSDKREGLWHLESSGYIRVQQSDSLLLIDVAPVGPDFQPGHAHADTLSFEFSIFGRRLIVNGGTSSYETGEIRCYERSTAAHSTVEIDGENSSQVWGNFRVAERAKPFDLEIDEAKRGFQIGCSHDGYKRLSGSPVHRRNWQVYENKLIVTDVIQSQFNKKAVSRFFIHPEVICENKSDNFWLLHWGDGKIATFHIISGEGRQIRCCHAYSFGCRLATTCFEIQIGTNGSKVEISW